MRHVRATTDYIASDLCQIPVQQSPFVLQYFALVCDNRRRCGTATLCHLLACPLSWDLHDERRCPAASRTALPQGRR